MICTNQTVVSAHPRARWEKLTFDQSFVSKQHQLIKFFRLRIISQAKKEGQRAWGHLETFWSVEQKPSVTNLKHKQLATWLVDANQ